jgi:aspartate/methionine/tyrosine aminotransferase
LRDLGADYAEYMLGIKGKAFWVFSQGRDSLGHAISFAQSLRGTQSSREEIVLPMLRWPMYDVMARIARLKIAEQRNPTGSDWGVGWNRNTVAHVTNTPENPRGTIYSNDFMARLAQYIDAHNHIALADNAKITHILDIPYFYAAPMKSEGAVFDCGYEHVTKPDSETPWVAVISFSKALGFAQPGLTLVVVHPRYEKRFEEILLTRNGLAYSADQVAKVIEAFDRSKWIDHVRHFQRLQEKYGQNLPHIQEAFGCNVLQADPGMVALVDMTPLRGARYQDSRFPEGIKVETAVDVADIMLGYGVVAVPNPASDGRLYLRFANAASPDIHAEGIRRARQAYDAIMALHQAPA